MPLMHSKTPKAFKKNIETEIKAGKPQKQAVAIAYSTKRRAEAHKYGSGGCVGSGCPGPHEYDDGGDVQSSSSSSQAPQSDWDRLKNFGQTISNAFEPSASADTKPTGSSAGSDSGAKKLGSAWKAAGYSKGGMAMDKMHSMDMPKEKMAHGGMEEDEMEDMDEDLPNEHDDDSEISDMLGKELCEAIHSKDHKGIKQSIEAIVHQCLNTKEDE